MATQATDGGVPVGVRPNELTSRPHRSAKAARAPSDTKRTPLLTCNVIGDEGDAARVDENRGREGGGGYGTIVVKLPTEMGTHTHLSHSQIMRTGTTAPWGRHNNSSKTRVKWCRWGRQAGLRQERACFPLFTYPPISPIVFIRCIGSL